MVDHHPPLRPAVRIRSCTPSDREAVLALTPRLTVGIAPWLDIEAVQAGIRAWVARAIDGMGPNRTVLVAEGEDGRCAGFVTVERQQDWAGPLQAYIGELVVAEEMEGTGTGRALVAAVDVWARAHSCTLVVLETSVANGRARRFYEQLGFVEESVRLVKVLAPPSQTEPKVL